MKLSLAIALTLVGAGAAGCAESTQKPSDVAVAPSPTPTTMVEGPRTVDAPLAPAAETPTASGMGSGPRAETGALVDATPRGAEPQPQRIVVEPPRVTEPPRASGTPAPAPGHAADNTGVNERDRSASALTPMDQGGSAADRRVTADIRKAIIAEGALSFTAKNVKIITVDGKVTLRGPVKTAAERAVIETKAKSVGGVKSVDNLLEVK